MSSSTTTGSTHLPTSSTPYSRGPMRPTGPWAASASSASGKRASSDSPPPAPIATKRRRFLDLINESDEEEHEAEVVEERRLVKKLAEEFDKVTMEAGRVNSTSPSKGLSGGSEGTRSRRSVNDEVAETVLKVAEEVNKLSFKDKNAKGKTRMGKENSQVSGKDLAQVGKT
ncbi:uncharacterized protein [Pyrus communis]|uniref:uncharacterized protein n=1 Tax=Pyrus communis TaxID=23211 RepID=UPI0035C15146